MRPQGKVVVWRPANRERFNTLALPPVVLRPRHWRGLSGAWPQCCGTCRHWDGAVDDMGYGGCDLPGPVIRVPHFAGQEPGVGCRGDQGRRCPAWTAETPRQIRRCLPLLRQDQRRHAQLTLYRVRP